MGTSCSGAFSAFEHEVRTPLYGCSGFKPGFFLGSLAMPSPRDAPVCLPSRLSATDLAVVLDAVPLARSQLAGIGARLIHTAPGMRQELAYRTRRVLSGLDNFGRGIVSAGVRGKPVQVTWTLIGRLVLVLGYAAAEAERRPELTGRRSEHFGALLERISGGTARI